MIKGERGHLPLYTQPCSGTAMGFLTSKQCLYTLPAHLQMAMSVNTISFCPVGNLSSSVGLCGHPHFTFGTHPHNPCMLGRICSLVCLYIMNTYICIFSSWSFIWSRGEDSNWRKKAIRKSLVIGWNASGHLKSNLHLSKGWHFIFSNTVIQ